MANPFDEFDAAPAANPFDEFDNGDDNLGEKSIGMLEAGASMVAGLPSQIAGGVHGLGALLSGKGIEGANQALEGTMKSNFGFGEYVPSTKSGKKYAANLGKALNKPIEWAGDAGEFVGGDLGRLSGEVMAGTAMALIDPLVIGAGAKAMIGKAGQGRKGPDLAGLKEELKPIPVKPKELENLKSTEELGGQMNLFDQFDEVQGRPNQFQAEPTKAVWRTDENGIPVRADLSMEAANLEAPLQRNLFGDELGPALDQGRSLTDSIDSVTDNWAKHRQMTNRLGGDGKDLVPGNDLRAAMLEAEGPKFTPDSNFNTRTRRQGGAVLLGEENKRMPLDVAWLAKDKDRFAEPSSTDLKTLTDSIRREGVKEPITITVSPIDGKGYVTDGNNRLAGAMSAGLKDVPYKVEITNVAFSPDQLAKALDLDTLGITRDQLAQRPKSAEALAAEDWLHSFNSGAKPYVPKSQKGAIKIDWRDEKPLNQFKKIPGMDRRLKNLLPDVSTPEEFLATHKNTPDIKQNVVQRGFNMLTKGGVYQTMKTNNPLVKRVVDRFVEADNLSRGAIQAVIHEYMEPLARKLNNNEKADVWAAVKAAEAAKTPLTPEAMKKYGFNDKQIAWVEAHQTVMAEMFNKLKESMEAAGLKPVSPQVAYVASRARGDFRKLVYNKDGDIIGILGSNTRMGLEKDAAKYKKLDPNAVIGAERFYGGEGKSGTAEGFNQMLEFLSQNDPAIKDFVKKVNEQASKDAFEYLNAKSHTMAKKGIWGMEGNRPFADAVTNAKEGMRAQVRYAELMIKWSEISKAVKETKELLNPENGLDMPNAKAYLNDYVDTALGKNPTVVGRAVDGLADAFGRSTGIGTTIPASIMTGAKQVTNGLLLGLNIPFLAANILQPFKAMPEMSAWLKSMGLEKKFDAGTGYSYLAKGALDAFKGSYMKDKLDPVISGAFDYAKKHHVYASDLFETGGDVSYTPRLIGNKVTQFGASRIERDTRQMMFLAYTRMLHENGITPKQGLYEAARKVTDMAMNNYSHLEAPMAYNAMGGVGSTAYNLMSYKHNELSRFSMFARELVKDKSAAPLLTSLAAQIAFAGVKGTILYAEANELIKFISDKMGKPTSLTKMLLDSDVSKFLTFGMFSGIGLDMSNRLGMQVLPESPGEALFPGGGKIVDVAKNVGEVVAHPNEFNAKKAIHSVLPGTPAGIADRAWFSPKNAQGEEMSLNKNKVQVTATRNNADKAWKSVGATGLNESIQRTKSYENTQIKLKYQNKRMGVLDDMSKEMFTNKGEPVKIPMKLFEKYFKYEGDPNTLAADLERMAKEQSIDPMTLNLLSAQASQSITKMHDLNRRLGKQ